MGKFLHHFRRKCSANHDIEPGVISGGAWERLFLSNDYVFSSLM